MLLVGETGGGKTTACQLISMVLKKKLATINCHANTEAADFIGGLRPVSDEVSPFRDFIGVRLLVIIMTRNTR